MMGGIARFAGASDPDARSARAVLLAMSALCLGFLSTLRSFPGTWSEDRSHGFLVAAFCVWLLWRERRALRGDSSTVEWSLVVLPPASLLWMVASIAGIRVGHQLMLPIIGTVWAAAVFGRRGFHMVGVVAAIFLLAVPFWEVLRGVLQAMTVAVNTVAVSALGLDATIDGNRIRFPFGAIEVAQSCAGLQYFMSALTISVIYARLFLRSTKARAATIAFAVVLALVSNWIRVFGLVLIGYRSRMQSPLMSEHDTYGWVIFAVVMVVYFATTPALERWESRQRVGPESDSGAAGAAPLVPRHLSMATAAALVGPVIHLALSIIPTSRIVDAGIAGIRPAASWVAVHPPGRVNETPARMDSMVKATFAPSFSGYSDRDSLMLARGADTVRVDRYLYGSQSQGRELVSSDNVVGTDIIAEQIVGPLDQSLRLVRQAIVRGPGHVHVVWYWYRVNGEETASPLRAKLFEVLAYFSRRGPSQLVAVSAQCGERDCAGGLALLHEVVTGRTLPVPRTSDAVRPSAAADR